MPLKKVSLMKLPDLPLKIRGVESKKPEKWFNYEIFNSKNKLIGVVKTETGRYNNEIVFVIYKLLIFPLYRKKGYGSSVIRFCEKLAFKMGFKKILALVKPLDDLIAKDGVKSFYEKNGFCFESSENKQYAIKKLYRPMQKSLNSLKM